MKIETIFCDANIILDLIDVDRGKIEKARSFVHTALIQDITLFTSCDILTNIYYVARKKVEKPLLVEEMLRIVDIFEIIEIDKKLAKDALIKNLHDNSLDFEDLIQLECAISMGCDLIVTDDKKFVKGSVNFVNLDKVLKIISRTN
jgi:predicted nucleic acid-binding protein